MLGGQIVLPVHIMRHMWGEVQLHSFLISSQVGGEWSTSRTFCFAPVKELPCPLSRRLEGPRAGLCVLQKKFLFDCLCLYSSPDLPGSYPSHYTYCTNLICLFLKISLLNYLRYWHHGNLVFHCRLYRIFLIPCLIFHF